MAPFGVTAKEWREANPDLKGTTKSSTKLNMRDDATIEQLVVLSNLESINALLIQQGVQQTDRLIELNRVAITQMKSLLQSEAIKKINRYTFTITENSLNYLATWHFDNPVVSFTDDKSVFDEKVKNKYKKVDFWEARVVLPN